MLRGLTVCECGLVSSTVPTQIIGASVKHWIPPDQRLLQLVVCYGGREGSPAPAFKSRAAKCKSRLVNVKAARQTQKPCGKCKSRVVNAKAAQQSVKAVRQMQKTVRLPKSCTCCILLSRGYEISFCISLNPFVNQEFKCYNVSMQ